MKKDYIVSVDQSTQGTKALLLDENGKLLKRADLPHKQWIDDKGWIEHDLKEILSNTRAVVKNLLDAVPGAATRVGAVGVSNQRETVAAWNRETGEPVCRAIVWQCARGTAVCERVEKTGAAEKIRKTTGLTLSPYFSASKMGWIMENVPEARRLAAEGKLCLGTMDSFLVYSLTQEKSFASDFSNASRTQLFDIHQLQWNDEICALFGINTQSLPEVEDSNSCFGHTDFGGVLPEKVPLLGVMGDSQSALFGQGCWQAGTAKTTYGTGSSIMLNIGSNYLESKKGLVTSLAWGQSGRVEYVLEGNINYTGAVITWLQKDLGLIRDACDSAELVQHANPEDKTYLVPAFSGLGAPYWHSQATGLFTGMTRLTGRAEMVKAGLESIAYQIADVVFLMQEEYGRKLTMLRADGGPTANRYLMQLQSDLIHIPVAVPRASELSGLGAAYMAGITVGMYDRESLLSVNEVQLYHPIMNEEQRQKKLSGWRKAVSQALV